MNKYRVVMAHGTDAYAAARVLEIEADTAIEAGCLAREQLNGLGYDVLKSCELIAFLG